MSNARELSELAGSYGTGGFVGMKNRIINGAAFDIYRAEVRALYLNPVAEPEWPARPEAVWSTP